MWGSGSSVYSLNRDHHGVLLSLGLAAILAASAYVLYTFDPSISRFYPPCAFRALTGLQCPGCGSTRALHQLLHGNVAVAFRMNPMLFVASGAAVMFAIRPALLTRPWVAWTAAGTLLAWSVLRNLLW